MHVCKLTLCQFQFVLEEGGGSIHFSLPSAMTVVLTGCADLNFVCL